LAYDVRLRGDLTRVFLFPLSRDAQKRNKKIAKGQGETNYTHDPVENVLLLSRFCVPLTERRLTNTQGGKKTRKNISPVTFWKRTHILFPCFRTPNSPRPQCPQSKKHPAQGASKKKEKENKGQKNNPEKQPTDFPSFFLFFFLGAPCVGCGPSVDMPPHVGTRSWPRKKKTKAPSQNTVFLPMFLPSA
jgi:hypothetical protein